MPQGNFTISSEVLASEEPLEAATLLTLFMAT
jgi:hypothetical protein